MTVIVGVRCRDGIVIGADSVATSAMGPMPLMQVQSSNKIHIYNDPVISAASGSVGYGQRLKHHITEAIQGGVFRGRQKIVDSTGNISRRFLTDLNNSLAQRTTHNGIGFSALLAVIINNELCLVEYDGASFQPELKKDRLFYVSIGSGQNLADPFLAFISRVIWKDEMPTVDVGKFGVLWALQHTIRHAAGGVGGEPQIAILKQEPPAGHAYFLSENDMQESVQYIAELEECINSFAVSGIEGASSEVPPVPPA